MNDSANIEELAEEVRRLQRSLNRVTIVLVIIVILYLVTGLPAFLTAFLFDPFFQAVVLVILSFVVFLICIFSIDMRWGLGSSN